MGQSPSQNIPLLLDLFRSYILYELGIIHFMMLAEHHEVLLKAWGNLFLGAGVKDASCNYTLEDAF